MPPRHSNACLWRVPRGRTAVRPLWALQTWAPGKAGPEGGEGPSPVASTHGPAHRLSREHPTPVSGGGLCCPAPRSSRPECTESSVLVPTVLYLREKGAAGWVASSQLSEQTGGGWGGDRAPHPNSAEQRQRPGEAHLGKYQLVGKPFQPQPHGLLTYFFNCTTCLDQREP